MTRQAGSHRARAIPRARESPCGTSRIPCSRVRTRRSSAPDRSSMSRAWLPWWSPPAVRCGASKADPSKRVWTDDFPAVALAEFVAFIVIDRAGAIQEFLDVAAGGGRGVSRSRSGRSSGRRRKRESPDSAASGRSGAGASLLVLAGPSARLGLRHVAYRLVEPPAVALEVERPVGALAPGVVAQLVGDPCTRGDGTLIVRINVVDMHADELALDAAAHGADRAVVALPADPDQAVAELHRRMENLAVRAHEPRGRDLTEPERALQERQRGADVLIWKLGHDRRSSRGLDLLPDCRHEHRLSPVERCRVERGLAPQLPRQVPRLHRDLTLLFPFGSSSSRRRARARLSRDRTLPIASSSASATPWYGSSPHPKSRSASRSPAGSPPIASATRGESRRAPRPPGVPRWAAPARPPPLPALGRHPPAPPRPGFRSKVGPSP